MQNFRALGAPPPNPVPPAAESEAPKSPKQPPPLRISGYAPGAAYVWLARLNEILVKVAFNLCFCCLLYAM